MGGHLPGGSQLKSRDARERERAALDLLRYLSRRPAGVQLSNLTDDIVARLGTKRFVEATLAWCVRHELVAAEVPTTPVLGQKRAVYKITDAGRARLAESVTGAARPA